MKSPKVYIIDSGLLHALLNLTDIEDLEGHPKLGASWEGFVIEQLIRILHAEPEECFFWGNHAGEKTFQLSEDIRAVSIYEIFDV